MRIGKGLLALVGLMVLAGCDDGGGSAGVGGVNGAMVGGWRLASVNQGNQSVTCPGALVSGLSCYTTTLTLNSDGTFAMNRDLSSLNGTGALSYSAGNWGVNGSTLTLHTTKVGDDTNRNGQIDPDELQTTNVTTSGTIVTANNQFTWAGITGLSANIVQVYQK